jgi:acetyltransferase-like isoleucine patch superfamily enzyme
MLKKKNRIPFLQLALIGLFPSFLKKIIYRLKGYKIGKNVSIGIGSIIVGKEVSINDNTSISLGVVIRVDKLKIGRNVRIGSATFIDTRAVEIDDDAIIGEMVGIGGIRTEQSLLKVGKRCHIFQYSLVNPTLPIILGDDSSIGYANYIFTHASWNSILDGYPVVFAPITIGKGVWLPSRVQIFPDVTIGDGAVIGAGSVVTKNIPAYAFAVGSPAKVVKENYPVKKVGPERKIILKRILSEFVEMLNTTNLKASFKEYEDYSLVEVVEKNKQHQIVFIIDKSAIKTIKDKVDLLIIDDELTIENTDRFKMIIDTNKKTRAGSSEFGEEFIKFISRYGIRLNRLD